MTKAARPESWSLNHLKILMSQLTQAVTPRERMSKYPEHLPAISPYLTAISEWSIFEYIHDHHMTRLEHQHELSTQNYCFQDALKTKTNLLPCISERSFAERPPCCVGLNQWSLHRSLAANDTCYTEVIHNRDTVHFHTPHRWLIKINKPALL